MKPCVYCKQVPNPLECENMHCRKWQEWFVSSWNDMRHRLRVDMESRPRVPEGEVIGGVHYALPHRVDDYLRTDPCEKCVCPRDLCRVPCRIKRDWVTAGRLLQ